MPDTAPDTAPDTGTILIELPDEAASRRFGEDLVLACRAGDVVALSGDLGAGKSTLARAMVRTHAGDPGLDVPSPTFTLVQAYETEPPIAHFDLYRLGEDAALDELGFDEAAEEGIVLCEWPERSPEVLARAALHVRLDMAGEGRIAAVSGEPAAMARLQRSRAVRAFLDRSGLSPTDRRRFFGDASPRRYETVRIADRPAILMDAPRIESGLAYRRIAHIADDVTPFVALAHLLRAKGFVAPDILFSDLDAGLLLIEHLGEDTILDGAGRPIPERYEAAALTLAALHGESFADEVPVELGLTHTIPTFDRGAMSAEVELLLEWYVPRFKGRPAEPEERDDFVAVWRDLFDRLRAAEESLVLRDVHSPNIIWRGDRSGTDRIGLLDFQDAMIGPAAYDLASLAQDARVDIAPELEMRLVAAYAAARRERGAFDAFAFEEAYAIMAAQRTSKILGLFVRLDQRDGKPQYLRHIPRLKTYLKRTLAHPALAALSELYARWGLLAP
ncbi:tRNA threonylcarbamoyladenosine biosynthesis protein TsaE [Aureimonas sp. Leaf460]|nr:tRNA threonylcarbamoyladenosine biosynthesis protein TsaE [Aureimonas sp. Leaf427]KQT81731.1 tRNA threonylcarbamoyladenosine biosynthesis protein TsaE [Aureimonas sp. Leaf460]